MTGRGISNHQYYHHQGQLLIDHKGPPTKDTGTVDTLNSEKILGSCNVLFLKLCALIEFLTVFEAPFLHLYNGNGR